MSTSDLRTAATGKAPANPLVAFSSFMDKFKPQLALALPKHMTADRMARLALTSFSTTPALQKCEPRSIAAAVMTAGQLGLEIGVNGQGFLVPYGSTCTFVPGWKGLQDLVNRTGRATSWTGAVFEGDQFEYRLGDSPFVHHVPGDEDDPSKMTHVYAVGRVNGSNWPIVEVWSVAKVKKHRDKYNKVGQRHYSFRDWEMYARKVPLLQVLKYLPSSVEVSNAIAVANAAEVGQRADILDGCVTVQDIDMPEGATSAADWIARIEGAADKASADEILQQAMAYGLPEADMTVVTKAHGKKWPSAKA
jgi:recombination protein RecT